MSEKDLFTGAPGAIVPTQKDPSVILVLKLVTVGTLRTLLVHRWHENSLQDVKSAVWLLGQLNGSTMNEVEAVLIDQARLALLQTEGIQAELFEAWHS